MGRQKGDGKGRLGGRQKGTPNKIKSDLKEWVKQIMDNGREQFEKDLKKLTPKERINVFTALLNYVLPKMQPIQGEKEQVASSGLTIIVQNEEEKKMIERIKDL